MSIFVLTITTEYDEFDMYFTTLEKAQNFIKDNYSQDNPKRIDSNYYEGKKNTYGINEWAVDQERL